MNKLVEKIIERIPVDTFTDTTVSHLVPGSPHKRYGLLKRAIKTGGVIHLRRGLYALSKKYQRRPINLYEIAQKIYGPSYVSFESALSYYGWIPEAVYAVTSASLKRSREVKTPLGLFSYHHIPSHKFFAGVDRTSSTDGIFLMATPWRALVDYMFIHKKNWKGLKSIIEDLRIDESHFQNVNFRLLEDLREASPNKRVKRFIDIIKKEIMT